MTLLEQWLPRAPRVEPPRELAPPTPLLRFLAGDHAEAVAFVWPAPHAEFLALPAARRHAAAIGFARLPLGEWPRLRDVVELVPMREVVAFVTHRPPRGLARALGHMGEALWAQSAYERLIALFAEEEASVVLRHAEAIDQRVVEVVHALPPALRQARIVASLPSAHHARTLGEAFALTLRINPRRPVRDIVRAWSRAGATDVLFRKAIEALKPERFEDHGPAPAMPKPYRAIVNRAALDEVALRFRNCVAGYVWEVAAGHLAIYVRDYQPAVMVALRRDIGGWRFAEALGPENDVLDEGVLRAIAADFAAAGVRIGPPVRAIEDRLEALADSTPPASEPEPLTWAQNLCLGQLWR